MNSTSVGFAGNVQPRLVANDWLTRRSMNQSGVTCVIPDPNDSGPRGSRCLARQWSLHVWVFLEYPVNGRRISYASIPRLML